LLQERGESDLASVARSIHDKLIARHPHVFESPGALHSAGEVKRRWEDLKREQEGGREDVFHHVPATLPALLYARKLQRRAAAIEFEYPDTAGALADLDDELRELKEALAEVGEPPPEAEPHPDVFAELGDVLFAAVNVARHVNVDPELALRTMARRFADRVERAEELAASDGRRFAELSLEEKDRYFDAAKEEVR
jgi:MazG family protein